MSNKANNQQSEAIKQLDNENIKKQQILKQH